MKLGVCKRFWKSATCSENCKLEQKYTNQLNITDSAAGRKLEKSEYGCSTLVPYLYIGELGSQNYAIANQILNNSLKRHTFSKELYIEHFIAESEGNL